MTDKEKIRNIIELFIAWNGETDVIDVANIDSAVEFIVGSLQEEPVSGDFEMALAEMIDNAQKRVVEPWVVAAQWKDELIELAKSEEPISEELNEAAIDYAESVDYRGFSNAPWNFVQDVFKAGAKWQEKQDQETIELAEDHAMFAGMEKMKEQLMAKAVDGVVHHFEKCKVASVHYNDPTGVPMAYFTFPEGLSTGDKVKIIVIKED